MKVHSFVFPAVMFAAFALSGCSETIPVAAPGGVYISESAGALFEQSVDIADMEGKYIADFPLQKIFRLPSNPSEIYIAAGDRGVVVSKDDGVTWSVIATPLTYATDVVALPSGVLVAAGQDGQGQGFVVRSLDEGVSWHSVFTVPVPENEGGVKLIGGGSARSSIVINLHIDPFNPGRIYGGSSLGSIFVGEQDAKTWSTFYTLKSANVLSSNSAQTGILSFAPSPFKAGELIVITDKKRLVRIANGTQTAIKIPKAIGVPTTPLTSGGESDVLDASYVPSYPDALLVGIGDGAAVTRDNGESWIRLSVPAETSKTFNSLIVRTSPTNANRIFVAINGVVYRSEDGGNTWNTFSLGLSGKVINDFSINPANAAKVLAVVRDLRV